ncbi:MAG: flagellin [Myxococcota bacterium]
MNIRTTWLSRLDYLSFQTNRIGGELTDVSQKLTTGLEISKPSDSPELTARLMNIKREIADQERFHEDSSYALNLLDVADQVLVDMSQVVSNARQLAVQMGSDTYLGPARTASAEQASQLLDQAMDLVNTAVAGRHLFAGEAYDTQPYADDLSYQGADEASRIDVSDQSNTIVGFVAEDLNLGSVLQAIADLQTALETDSADAVRLTLDGLIAATDTISNAQTTVGVEQATAIDFVDLTESMKLELEVQRSALEDADALEAVMRMSQLQSQYDAALAVTSQMNLGSLFDRI